MNFSRGHSIFLVLTAHHDLERIIGHIAGTLQLGVEERDVKTRIVRHKRRIADQLMRFANAQMRCPWRSSKI